MVRDNISSSGKEKLKIVILSNKGDIASRKAMRALKRKHSVVYCTCVPSYPEDVFLDIFDVDSVEGFLAYNKTDVVLICSSLFCDETYASKIEQIILSLISDCSKKGRKIVMFYEQHILKPIGDDRYRLLGENDSYLHICEEISNRILNYENGLVIKCLLSYGYDYSCDAEKWIYDFPNINVDNEIGKEHLGKIKPILIDEAAEVIASEVLSCGEVDLSDEETYSFSDSEKGIETLNRHKGCVFNLVYQLMPEDYFGGKRIAKTRIALGEKLALRIPQDVRDHIDYVVPVPKTGLYYAMGLSKALNIPYIQGILKENTKERSFQLLDTNDRKKFLKKKFSLIGEILENKSVLVVDEAIFTGTTLKMACRMLWEAGVKHIFLGIPTPKCYVTCAYYVQPKREMLLEYIRDDMLNEYFDVDNIFFQTVDDFMTEIPEIDELCTECFTGR